MTSYMLFKTTFTKGSFLHGKETNRCAGSELKSWGNMDSLLKWHKNYILIRMKRFLNKNVKNCKYNFSIIWNE
jgi:hypothetical protein